jgi:transcriptional regulator with XRE-family HTH domain
METVDFASLVKLIRRSRGLTQQDLAFELDVAIGTLNGWENGKHRPIRAQRKRLVQLAQQLGVEVPSSLSNSLDPTTAHD